MSETSFNEHKLYEELKEAWAKIHKLEERCGELEGERILLKEEIRGANAVIKYMQDEEEKEIERLKEENEKLQQEIEERILQDELDWEREEWNREQYGDY